MDNKVLKLSPYFSEKLWGSNQLKTKFKFNIDDKKYGEAWLISGMKDKSSYVIYEGKKILLDEFYKENKNWFNTKINFFPLLTKIITPSDYLSIQVHPNDDYAKKFEKSLGKPECWYIIDAPKDSHIIYGHNAKTKKQLENYVKNNQWDILFKKIKVNKGDFVYIPPGKVHALSPGVTVYELQKSSDVTYRFYDFDRRDKNNNLRPLHLKDCINVTSTPDEFEYIIRNAEGLVLDNKYFTLYILKNDFNKKIKNLKWAQITVIEGSAKVNDTLVTMSQSALIFAKDDSYNIKINGICLFSYTLTKNN